MGCLLKVLRGVLGGVLITWRQLADVEEVDGEVSGQHDNTGDTITTENILRT